MYLQTQYEYEYDTSVLVYIKPTLIHSATLVVDHLS